MIARTLLIFGILGPAPLLALVGCARFHQATVVTGRVVDEAGHPVARALVTFGSLADTSRREVTADAQGRFALEVGGLRGCLPLMARFVGYAYSYRFVPLKRDSIDVGDIALVIGTFHEWPAQVSFLCTPSPSSPTPGYLWGADTIPIPDTRKATAP